MRFDFLKQLDVSTTILKRLMTRINRFSKLEALRIVKEHMSEQSFGMKEIELFPIFFPKLDQLIFETTGSGFKYDFAKHSKAKIRKFVIRCSEIDFAWCNYYPFNYDSLEELTIRCTRLDLTNNQPFLSFSNLKKIDIWAIDVAAISNYYVPGEACLNLEVLKLRFSVSSTLRGAVRFMKWIMKQIESLQIITSNWLEEQYQYHGNRWAAFEERDLLEYCKVNTDHEVRIGELIANDHSRPTAYELQGKHGLLNAVKLWKIFSPQT